MGTGIDKNEAEGLFGNDGNVLKLDCVEDCTTLYIY